MDFLHQSSRGNRRALAGVPFDRRSGVHQQKRRQIAARGLHRIWLAGFGCGSAADSSGQGTRGRLVWVEFYFDAGDHRGRVPGVAGPLRVESQRTDCGRAAVQESKFQHRLPGDVHGWGTVVCFHGADAAISANADAVYGRKAGLVMSAAALVLLMELPLVGRLTTKVQGRHLVAFGWLALACTMYLSTKRIDLQISFGSATWLRILQYIPLGFIFIPASTLAYTGIPGEKNNAVAGLINFTRNIGSSVGTSLVTTIIARRTQFHQGTLTAHASTLNPNFQGAIEAMAQRLTHAGLSSHEAQQQALARFYQGLQA